MLYIQRIHNLYPSLDDAPPTACCFRASFSRALRPALCFLQPAASTRRRVHYGEGTGGGGCRFKAEKLTFERNALHLILSTPSSRLFSSPLLCVRPQLPSSPALRSPTKSRAGLILPGGMGCGSSKATQIAGVSLVIRRFLSCFACRRPLAHRSTRSLA